MFKIKNYIDDIPLLATLVALIVLALSGELFTARIVKNQFLTSEALRASQDWLKAIQSHIPELETVMTKGSISIQTKNDLARSDMRGQVFRFRLYGQDFVPLYDSAQRYVTYNSNRTVLRADPDLSAALEGIVQVDFAAGDTPNLPEYYARAFVPILINGEIKGALEVYVNQTQSNTELSNAFQTVAIVTVFLLSTFILLIGGIVCRKRKERRETEMALQRTQSHDKLTGLLNRDEFLARLTKMIEDSDDNDERVVVCSLDIDDFKTLNDTLGFDIGNQILINTSTICTENSRKGDIVARVSDDKFAIAMCRVFGRNGIQTGARRLSTRMTQPMNIDGNIIHLTASIGIGYAVPGELEASKLLKNAEVALRWCKADGGGTIRVFQQSMDKTLHERMNLEHELRHAFNNDELDLYYQPQIDMRNGGVIGCEALMRWNHPKRGFISPEVFISIAEQTGLIHRLGEWALDRACRDALRWRDPVKVAVNLSPKQIEAGSFENIVSQALEKSGLPTHRLELEVTENILLKKSERAIATLDQLRDMGVAIAMDDFGTGYSSLAYLSQFRFDKIKIDRSFIMKLHDDPKSLPIVRAMIGLGRSLGSRVIAEGVETILDAKILQQEGCHLAQGYFYAKPMPQAELLKFLDEKAIACDDRDSKMVA